MLYRGVRKKAQKVLLAKMESELEKLPENHTHLVNTFCEITSSSKEEALFFLESHTFDLDLAVSTFLETTTATATATVTGAADLNLSPSPSRSPSPSPSRSRSLSPRPNPYDLRSKKPMVSSSSNTRRTRTGGIRTLSDLNRQAGDDDSDSDEKQEYYTGGEKSGMLVQDPSKANNVDAIFNHARQFGAVERPAEDLHPSSNSRSFTGTGRLLSGETVSSAAQQSAAQQPEAVTHNIVFWINGFTVDDGPLRRLDDPENASFLESIKKSECPKELEPTDKRTPVKVNLMRKEQNFHEPEKPHNPFQGAGRTLGSASSTTPSDAAASLNTAPPPSMGLVVDDTSPSTSIQLRLADGTRMVSRFNYHHTIRDIRGFIDASRPSGVRTYQLQAMGFPPKQLTDLEETIQQAGLANSVVIQKL